MEEESHIGNDWRIDLDLTVRARSSALDRELRDVAENPMMRIVLDAAGSDMFVVNPELQIIAANTRFTSRRCECSDSVVGQRIGEAYHCMNAAKTETGCGTAMECDFCGLLHTVLKSRKNKQTVVGECLMQRDRDGGDMSAEYSVTASPLNINDRAFTVISLQDIADRKRKEMLERLFVHDIKNSLQGIIGWSEILAENLSENIDETAARIGALTRILGEEIETHRLLVAAESETLKPNIRTVKPPEFLGRIKTLFAHHELAYTKSLEIVEPVSDREIQTDPVILRRILVNMITNALEATDKGSEIRIGCTWTNSACRFWVWNQGVLPREVAANIFKRSFSTKAHVGRGLGTYSMKLFGEQVLGGRLSFHSDPASDTTFYLDLPTAKL